LAQAHALSLKKIWNQLSETHKKELSVIRIQKQKELSALRAEKQQELLDLNTK
jgi:hypothetical protein